MRHKSVCKAIRYFLSLRQLLPRCRCWNIFHLNFCRYARVRLIANSAVGTSFTMFLWKNLLLTLNARNELNTNAFRTLKMMKRLLNAEEEKLKFLAVCVHAIKRTNISKNNKKKTLTRWLAWAQKLQAATQCAKNEKQI